MASVQNKCRERMIDNVQQSVFLVIDVLGADADSVEDLKENLAEFSDQWVREKTRNMTFSGPQYTKDVGIFETKKLCIFESRN